MIQLGKVLSVLFLLLFTLSCGSKGDHRTASRESALIAPIAKELDQDIFQIYVARAWSWRGYFAVHPWVAWKKAGEKEYTTAAVIGFRMRNGKSSVVVHKDVPDRRWFDSMPELIFQAYGAKAGKIIKQMPALIKSYPYHFQYRAWPGPNSNTFVSYLIRSVDEIDAELPAHAIGKDWLARSYMFDSSPSGKGYQMSLLGVAGLTVGLEEGVELNFLSLNFGVDFWPLALKLPFVGRVGMDDGKIQPIPSKKALTPP
ncbi:MAG: DUF3750 domain-containing protein [Bacteriovoracaceae bacterium]